MKLTTTTADFEPYCKSEREKLEAVRRAGFEYVDLSMYRGARPDNWLRSDEWKTCANEIKSCAEEVGLTFVQAHSPGGNLLSTDHGTQLFETTVRSIGVCGILGIPFTVIHAGTCGNVSFDEFCEKNAEVYEKLLPYAKESRVKLLIENTGTWTNETYFFTGKQMKQFAEFMNSEYIGVCWDTGHANVMNYIQSEEIGVIGRHLCAVHIQDNFGKNDDHIAPFFGTLDIDDVMKGLLDVGFSGPFTFEADQFPIFGSGWPNSRKHNVSEARLYNPDISIKDSAEKLLFEIGKSILSKYGLSQNIAI